MEYQKFLNAMRYTALYAIKNAKQGHTGMAISAIPIIYSLYAKNIVINTNDGKWFNRDRFVLSAGHGSMSLYSIFYLSKIYSKDDILNYRNNNTRTAGHPEFENLKENFIDCSTGPLGQGVANGVGMAIAQAYMEKKYSSIKELINHYTYVVVGDGDLQEGVCYEAMSLAGKLKLNKLIILHDSNEYQLDSSVKMVNNENLKKRVESQNWKYLKTDNNIENICNCIEIAKKSNKPTFIEVKTIIGEGTSAQSSHKAHGLKVDENEINNASKHFNMNFTSLDFDNEIFDHFNNNVIKRSSNEYKKWLKKVEECKVNNKKLVDSLFNEFNQEYSNLKLEKILDEFIKNEEVVPTKNYVKEFFEICGKNKVNNIITLSADLASTTFCKNSEISFNENRKSPYVMAGIREFSMGCIQNGILLHGGLKSISGTFLSFSDYIKPAIRVGALSKLPSIYIFTHDSYLVGGDGPTHQPYDQLPMLRSIQNCYDIRPCNRNEFALGMRVALNSKNKTYSFILTRQNINVNNVKSVDMSFGAYQIYQQEDVDVCIVANGSEVELALKNIDEIQKNTGLKISIVSAPIMKLFLEQSDEKIKEIIKSKYGVLVIEATNDANWYKLLKYTPKLEIIDASTFGESMDGNKLYQSKGFNKENIINKIKIIRG